MNKGGWWGVLEGCRRGKRKREVGNDIKEDSRRWIGFIWASLTGCLLDLKPSFFLRCPRLLFLCLTSVPPTPACFGNSVFICRLQHVALSLEDDGYPWGEGGCVPPTPPPHSPRSSPGPSSHHNLYITTMRPAQYRRERDGVLILPPYLRSRDDTYIFPVFSTGNNNATTASHCYSPPSDSVFVVSAPLLSSLCLSLAVVACQTLLDHFLQTNLIRLSWRTL